MQYRSYLPSLEQEDLLKAALWDGPRALQHWKTFKSKVPFDDIDYGSSRLLPLVYKNLVALAPNDPFMGRMKGIYRLTWAQNQRNLNQLLPVLELFNEHGIPRLLLKGAALTLSCYQDFGLRGMGDLDLLIPSEHAKNAMTLLEQSGWDIKKEHPQLRISIHHAAHFINKDSNIDLDLHWHLLFLRCNEDIDGIFWQDPATVQFNNKRIRTLRPVDHLFHTLVHGAAWNHLSPIRWVADAYFLIFRETIDWDRLVYLVKRCDLALPIRDTLNFLENTMELSIPREFETQLKSIKIPRWHQKEYDNVTRNRPFLGILPLLWIQHANQCGSRSYLYKMVKFPNYVHQWYGFEKYRHLAGHLIRKGFEKLSGKFQKTEMKSAPHQGAT